jgi:putative CocE/NonD family hydrolase
VSGALVGGGAGALTHLPSMDILRAAGVPETDYDRLITMSPVGVRWLGIDFIRNGDHPRVPALHVNGWHDVGAYETIKLFEYLAQAPNQYLIMAPTPHCAMLGATERTMAGERLVGDARLPYEDLFAQWFDAWLKDPPGAAPSRPKVQVFLEGANRWITAPSWPVPNTTSTRFYLRSDGRAQSRAGTGRLAVDEPNAEPADSFRSDPSNPVPSRGGGCCDRDAVRDQRPVEDRRDVLVYSTEPLRTGLAVVGEIKGVLYLSSSALDTDLAVKLVDVYPDGRAFNLYDAMVRVRYRNGFDRPAPMEPGTIYPVEVTGLVAGNYFGPGHRIRIEVASSNFPNFERNLQTGGANYDETHPVVATNRIHHDAAHRSYFEFPVLPQ